jgi:lycopene beta-cyclase
LKNKTILILEPSTKTNNDKTYCFWSFKEDPIIQDLSCIISRNFESIKINNSTTQIIEEQPYYYIRSIDLYNHTLDQVNREKITIVREGVTEVNENNELYSIHTSDNNFFTQFIFDSRPPLLKNLNSQEIYINQSFFGLHVKCENAVFQKEAFEMMNFNVEQNGATQFFYVIPFSSDEALVELTRFGVQKIDLNYASDLLKEYIFNEFGPYKIIADETGCIPMTTYKHEPSEKKGILFTGMSANLIKPSTGYGFKNMYSFAQKVSERISKNQYDQFNTINLNYKKRFQFYDTLLLIILLKWPQQGKKIFTQLYKRQSATRIFTFLDEKTTFFDELRIFASLPIIPFLKAVYVFLKGKRYLRYILALLIVSTYLILLSLNDVIASIFGYTALLTGLVGLGIPHGALDHLLLNSKKFSLPFFLFKYSAGIVLYFLLWQLYPLFSLVLFIIYSSLHFGESELVDVKTKLTPLIFIVKSFLLGFSILLFIISTHIDESIHILTYLNLNVELAKYNSESLSWTISILSFSFIFIQNLLSKGNPYIGLLFLLVLGIPTPLIIAFGLYFILQHSDNAWKHLMHGLHMNSIGLYRKAFVYTLCAFLVFGLIILNAEKFDSFHALWLQFFIFIACISLPHFIIMHLFYKKRHS